MKNREWMDFCKCDCCGKEDWCHWFANEHLCGEQWVTEYIEYFCEACCKDMNLEPEEYE